MDKLIQIPIEQIQASRYQPRLKFDEKGLEELAQSIRENGLIQPITVRQVQDHYEIVAGERRLRACRIVGLDTVDCYVMTPTENQAAQMALVENVQREDLTAVEEAKAYVQIMRQAELTQEQVAAKIGKSQSTVANKIRLLNLPEEIQKGVTDKVITERHARALLVLPEELQSQAYHYIVDRSLNVRQTEAYVEKIADPEKIHRRQKTKGFTRNVQVGINSVNQCVRLIKKMGIDVVTETDETLTDVRIIVRFLK